MTRPLTWAIGTFGAIAIMATFAGEHLAGLTARKDAPAATPAVATAPPQRQAAPPRPASPPPAMTGPGTMVIQGDSSGHFSVEGRLHGERISMMVDTGASSVALREEDVRRAGIALFPSSFTGRGSTANGAVAYAPIMLRSLQIGDIEVRDVEAVVIPAGKLQVNLLGMSFLKRLRGFDISNNRLVLRT